MFLRRDDGSYVGIRNVQPMSDGCARVVTTDGSEVILAPDDARHLLRRMEFRTFEPAEKPWPAPQSTFGGI